MSRMSDLDLDIRDAIDSGEHPSEIAKRLNVPTAWVQDIAEEMNGPEGPEFDENLDIELEDSYEDDGSNDGQPDEYTEWQDYLGGDDWDHGQYDTEY